MKAYLRVAVSSVTMRDLGSDLRTCVHLFLESDPRAAWRLSATCKERRSATGLCPPVLLIRVKDKTVAMAAVAMQKGTYYDVKFLGKTILVSPEASVFSACLYRHRMPKVTFSGRIAIQEYYYKYDKGNTEFKYIFKDPLSQWKIHILTNGRCTTHRTYPSGPRDNNDYLYESSRFVPESIVSAYVSSMSPFDVAM